MRLWTGLLMVFLSVSVAKSQAPYVLPHTYTDHILQRLEILHGTSDFSSFRNRSRMHIAETAGKLYLDVSIMHSELDKFDLRYLLKDNNEYLADKKNTFTTHESKPVYVDSTGIFYTFEKKNGGIEKDSNLYFTRSPVLKYFYHTPAHFLEVNKEDFKLRINPIVNLSFGKEANNPNPIFQNTRGVEVRGLIDDKLYFYTSLLENQRNFYNYIDRRIQKFRAIPGNGSFKSYESSVIGSLTGYDYLNAQAYVGLRVSNAISIELGHGKHFIGNGIRSLLLSDTGHNYFYLKLNTQVWKFRYQNIFAELAPLTLSDIPGDRLLPKKYMATHYLSFQPTDNFEIGLFETVIFGRENHFELQYLNPIIIYRTVEFFLGSPDNVMLGLNVNWNFLRRFSLYGQILVDEFKISEFTDGTGWWANKYGLQLGLKYINVLGIDHLDLQTEANIVRPYTYSHRDPLEANDQISLANYSHYSQPLAHPLGANFKEFTGQLRYQPIPQLVLHSRAVWTQFGDDEGFDNWGGNILIPSNQRERDFNNEIGQGVQTDILLMGLDISYQVFHNYFVDLNILYRKANADLESHSLNTKYIGGGIRINLGNDRLDY